MGTTGSQLEMQAAVIREHGGPDHITFEAIERPEPAPGEALIRVGASALNHLDIFVRGTDNGLWQLGFNGTSWTGWKSLGGYWTSAASAVCRPGTTSIDLFASGADSALWTTSVTGS